MVKGQVESANFPFKCPGPGLPATDEAVYRPRVFSEEPGHEVKYKATPASREAGVLKGATLAAPKPLAAERGVAFSGRHCPEKGGNDIQGTERRGIPR